MATPTISEPINRQCRLEKEKRESEDGERRWRRVETETEKRKKIDVRIINKKKNRNKTLKNSHCNRKPVDLSVKQCAAPCSEI